MTVKAPPRQKPSSADEVARVLRIYRLLDAEMNPLPAGVVVGRDTEIIPAYGTGDILIVADRIAARTQD